MDYFAIYMITAKNCGRHVCRHTGHTQLSPLYFKEITMKRTAIKLRTINQEKKCISDKLLNNKSLVEHAIYYHKLGWSVIPLKPREKIPYMKWEEYQRQRATPKQIHKWWKDFPNANIGIITGNISNLVVLDFDSVRALLRFRIQVCSTPNTIKQRTGSGYHYFFSYPKGRDIRNKIGLMKDVDLRAEAGFVVVAPSIHKSGKRYEWQDITPMEDGLKGLMKMPQKILDFCLKDFRSPKLNKKVDVINILDGVKEGVRDDTLFRYACRLKNKGLSRAEVEVFIKEAAKNCSPPFPVEEALTKVKSAWSYPDSKALKIKKAREMMHEKTSKKKGITVRKLMRTKLPKPKWALEGVLCEGLNILAGKPKVGKSFFGLNICMAIADGKLALDKFKTEKGSVICFALEDTMRRLQSRLKVNIPTRISKATRKMRLINVWPRMGDGGLDSLEDIDTLQWFRPRDKNKDKNTYTQDYEQMMLLKKIADKYRIAILLVHHLRKTTADDIFDTISGSFGLTGGADGLLALENKEGKYILHIRGRDIDEQEYAMKFSPTNLSWSVIGDADEVKTTNHQQLLYDAVKNAEGSISPKDLVKMTGLKENYVHKNMIKLLTSGDVKKLDRGKYQFINKE